MTNQEYMNFDINKLTPVELEYFKRLSFRTFCCAITPKKSTQYAWRQETRPLYEFYDIDIKPEHEEFLKEYESKCKTLCNDMSDKKFENVDPYDMLCSSLATYGFAGLDFKTFNSKPINLDFRGFMTEVNTAKNDKYDDSYPGTEALCESLKNLYYSLHPEFTSARKKY